MVVTRFGVNGDAVVWQAEPTYIPGGFLPRIQEFTVPADPQAIELIAGNLRRNIERMREALPRLGDAMGKVALSFKSTTCACGHRADTNWVHEAEECTWKDS